MGFVRKSLCNIYCCRKSIFTMAVFYLFCTRRSSTKREKLEEAQDEQPEFSDLDEPLKECTLSSVNAIGKEVRKRHCIVID